MLSHGLFQGGTSRNQKNFKNWEKIEEKLEAAGEGGGFKAKICNERKERQYAQTVQPWDGLEPTTPLKEINQSSRTHEWATSGTNPRHQADRVEPKLFK